MEKIDKHNNLIVTNKTLNWNDINWKLQFKSVQRLRHRIFKTTSELNSIQNRNQKKLNKEQAITAKTLKRKIRNLQKLLMKSLSNILVSVRKITQINSGKNTSGVDKLLITTPNKREELVNIISKTWNNNYTPKAILRRYIPKKNGKTRPLGIPTVYDRCIQNMVRNTLEPYWEAIFEGISYGFRPGRSAHDAISKIYLLARPHCNKKWIVDADIEKCFDNINHEYLMYLLKGFPYAEYIKRWLKSNVIDNDSLITSNSGTPQGGVISPLLANIALHGMEKHLGIKYRSGVIHGKRAIVRYADDFVIFCETQEDSFKAIEDLKNFLSDRGLNLSESKTRVRHITEGFDFLGFNVRHYKVNNTKTGYKCLIKPSKDSIKNVKYKIKQIFKENLSKPLDSLINKVNELIRGWGNYYRIVVSKKIFSYLDDYLFIRQVRYANRTHPKRNSRFKRNKYWGRFHPKRKDRWVFGNKSNGLYITKFAWIPIKRHQIIKQSHSPDDPNLKEYFAKRQKKLERDEAEKYNIKWRKVAQRQNFRCPHCEQSLFNGESSEIHHIIPKALGGKDYTSNLVILHYYCHKAQHKTRIKNEIKYNPSNPNLQIQLF